MIGNLRILIAVAATVLLSACGSTGQFVEAPRLEVRGAFVSTSQAVKRLFVSRSTPYGIALCEADPLTGQCLAGNASPSATGLGGLFLPLVMELEFITVEQASIEDGSIPIETTLNAPVNDTPSSCGKVKGTIEATATSAILRLPNNYCNWMAIGNVVQNAMLSIETIDLENDVFTGYYKISFYGTGNASGSGYYRAEISSTQQDVSSET